MGRRLRALALAGALIAASAGLATTTATAAASAPPLSWRWGTLRVVNRERTASAGTADLYWVHGGSPGIHLWHPDSRGHVRFRPAGEVL